MYSRQPYVTYRNPSSSARFSYVALTVSVADTRVPPINRKSPTSGPSFILFRMTYINCPIVKSPGQINFFLSMSGIFEFFAFLNNYGDAIRVLTANFQRFRLSSFKRIDFHEIATHGFSFYRTIFFVL